MDAIDSVVDPLREFSKDSIRLVKRCHKPDRKGNSAFGILQGRAPDSDRVRRDGFRRVLRQADLHPHQQYHRRICLGHAEDQVRQMKGAANLKKALAFSSHLFLVSVKQ
ncbi:hypothetical protein DVH24_035656 [Malus domestica]|uniref:Uncharacterized protein n=1 Tax=Malus domestica TaxID=3750 RepID=A0A498JML6_MALDO|nr:hypothetical protein DVH24_035656 [Malus domestica]